MTLNVTDFVNIKRSVLFIVFICFSFVIAQDTQDFEKELYDFFQFEDCVENPVSEEMNQIMNPDFMPNRPWDQFHVINYCLLRVKLKKHFRIKETRGLFSS